MNSTYKDTLTLDRKKFLEIKKRIGWWVEFNDSHEEYRMMQDRKSWIVISKEDHDYFKATRTMVYLPQVAKLRVYCYEGITENWGDYRILNLISESLLRSIKEIVSPELRSGLIIKEYSGLIDTCIAYGIVRDRIEFIKPLQGKNGTWKTFLKL